MFCFPLFFIYVSLPVLHKVDSKPLAFFMHFSAYFCYFDCIPVLNAVVLSLLLTTRQKFLISGLDDQSALPNCCFSCRADDPAGLKISRTCLFSLFYEFLSFFPVPKMYGSVQNSYLTNCGFSDMKKSASHQVGCDADFSLWLNLHKCRNSFAIRSSPIFSHGCGGLTQDPFYPGMSSTAPMPDLWRPPLLR